MADSEISIKARRGMSDTSPEAGPTSLRSSAPNPLRINLGTIGVDNGGGLQCFGQGPVPCLVSDGVSYVDNNDTSQGRFAQYRYAGPVYVTVDVPNTAELQVEYNLDGSAPSCSSAGAKACTFYHSGDLAIQLARAVSYSGKTRIVLYAASTTVQQTQGWFDYSMPNAATLPRCSNLTVWVCSSGSGPKQISVLNITDALSSVNKLQLTQSSFDTADETLGPLEPGPTVRIQILVATSLTDAALTEMREQLCAAVWNVSESSEQCQWQMWATVAAGANVEVWSDADQEWVMSNNGFGATSSVWTVSLTVLSESNSAASWTRYRITNQVNSAAFMQQFQLIPMVNVTVSGDSGVLTSYKQYFAHVTAPSPSQRRGTNSKYGCLTHYECGSGLFCSYFALWTWNGNDLYVGGGAGCDDCRSCFDSEIYTQDGACPEDKCGPRVGTYPRCWDSQSLLQNFTCPDKYRLNLDVIPGVKRGSAEVASLVSQPTTLRARFLTPFNRLIGAVIIRQKRTQKPIMSNSGIVCSLNNDTIAKYSSTADPSRGLICLGNLVDRAFYGTDSAFSQFSTLYDGKLNPFDFYKNSEFSDLSSQSPFGFFPHRYDYQTGKDKSSTLVEAEADNFLVYLDERISSRHAQDIITYLKDGGYLDKQTSEVTVEINTLNAATEMFCKFIFTFAWQVYNSLVFD